MAVRHYACVSADLWAFGDESLPTVAFLGLGRMGSRLAAALVRQGFPVTVWNRSPGKAGPLVAAGAAEEVTAARAARHADLVLLMMSDADAVRSVLFGGGTPVVDELRGDAVVVDLTTTGPRGARSIGADLAARRIAFVEAPVVGSTRAAAEGTLTTLVAGQPDAVERAMPALQSWSAPGRVVQMGGIGAANAAKLVAVVTQAVAIEGLGEALRLGRDAGLDRTRLMEALRVGVFGPLVAAKEGVLLSQATDDADYPVDMFVSEMSLALYEAAAALPAAEAAYLQGRLAASQGRGSHDVAEIALRREGAARAADDTGEHVPPMTSVP